MCTENTWAQLLVKSWIVHKTFYDYRRLQVITEHNYDYIKFWESVITIMIMNTQKM